MNSKQMAVFMSVCKTHNMSETGRRLNYAQPNVSRMIHEIEEEYQVKLFDDSGQMNMTDQGAILYRYCSEVDSKHSEMLHKLHGKTALDEIRIGVLLSVSGMVFPAMHIALQAAFPEKRFHYFINNKEDLLALWEEKKIDAMICYDSIDAASLSCIEIYHDDIAFYRSTNAAIPDTLSPLELSLQPLILCEKGSSLREQFDAAMKKHGLSGNILMESANNALVLQMVLKNQGIALLPNGIAKRMVEAGMISPILIPAMHFHTDFILYVQEEKTYIQLFRELTNTIASRFGEWLDSSDLATRIIHTAQES